MLKFADESELNCDLLRGIRSDQRTPLTKFMHLSPLGVAYSKDHQPMVVPVPGYARVWSKQRRWQAVCRSM
jgi:hypothetical protein